MVDSKNKLDMPSENIEDLNVVDIHDRIMDAYYGKLGEEFMRKTQNRIHWICSEVVGSKVVDVGCSQGIVPILLAREGFDITGVDTSPRAIEEAKAYLSHEPEHVQKKVNYINADFNSIGSDIGGVDTVVLSEILEHLVRPEVCVENAYKILKNDGVLIVTVPFGINDFIDHKHTFYLLEPYKIVSKYFSDIKISMLDNWLGIVAKKSENGVGGSDEILDNSLVSELEKSFYLLERYLREGLKKANERCVIVNKNNQSSILKIKDLNENILNLEKISESKDVNINSLEKKNNELDVQNDKLNQELISNIKANKNHEQQLKQSVSEKETMALQHAADIESFQDLEQQLKQSVSEKETMALQHAAVIESLQDLEQQLKQSVSEKETMALQHAADIESFQDLEQRFKLANGEIKKAHLINTDLTMDCQNLRNDFNNFTAEIECLNERRENVEGERIDLENKLQVELERSQLLNDNLEFSDDKRAGHYNNLVVVRRENELLNEKLNKLSADITILNRQLDDLKRSKTYQAGVHVRNATTLKGLIRLPLALYRLKKRTRKKYKSLIESESAVVKNVDSVVIVANKSKPPTTLNAVSILEYSEMLDDKKKIDWLINSFSELSSVEIAKNLRKIVDLGHLSVANELLLHVNAKDKIKYRRHVQNVIGYSDLSKRFPDIPNKQQLSYVPSDTICMVNHASLPYQSNGYATRTHEIAKQLSKNNNLIVLTRPGYPADVLKQESESCDITNYIDDVEYRSVSGAHYYDDSISNYIKKASRVLIKQFLEIRPKVVHAASAYHNALPALIAARKLGIPFVYEVRGFWEVTRASTLPGWGRSERYQLEHKLEGFVAKNADQVVALTDAIKSELIDLGVNKKVITVVPNAISEEKFKSSSGALYPVKLNDAPTIGYVGSIVEYEGLDDLVSALEIIHAKGIEFNFIVAGDGNQLPRLQEQVENSSIKKLSKFLGRIPHEEVGSLLNIIDITPFPRKPVPVCEMVSPLKPFESMLLKKAIIASDVNALSEIITDGINGLLFKKGSVEDLAEKLQKLIESRELTKNLGCHAQEWVLLNRTWETVSRKYSDIYDQANSHKVISLPEYCAPKRVLIYGDVDLNYIDGSSIWAASITEVFSLIENVRVDILLKSDAYKSKVIKQILSFDKSIRIISPSDFNVTKRFENGDAAEYIAQLHQDKNYDIVLVRGQSTYSKLAALPEMDGLLWVYPIEIFQKPVDEIIDDDLIPLRRAGKIVCQSKGFKGVLNKLNFHDNHIVLIPPMVPDRVKPHFKKVLDDKFKIVYAGKFDKQWGVIEMFDTFNKLHKINSKLELHVYGEKIHNPERSSEFEDLINNALRSDGVVWHKGAVRDVVLQELPMYDLAWAWRLPELDENTHEISTKFLEYSSAALPIICLDGKTNKQILGENYPLFIRDKNELVPKILNVIGNNKLLKKAGDRSYKGVSPFFYTSIARDFISPAFSGKNKRSNTTILFVGHDLKFINAHMRLFREKGFVVKSDVWKGHNLHDEFQSYDKLAGANVVICEWALGNSVWYADRKLLSQITMVRFHRQEIETAYPMKLYIPNIDFYNFINHQVKRSACEKFYTNEDVGSFFPNYINFKELNQPKVEGTQFVLGMVGIVPKMKRLDLALDLLESLRKNDSRYVLRIKGRLPEEYQWLLKRKDEMHFFKKVFDRIKDSKLLKDAVIFDGHGDDMPQWFTQVGYILSVSDFEGSHQAVAEGMASGCIPLMLPWKGADELYPSKYVFKSIQDISSKLSTSGFHQSENDFVKDFVRDWDVDKLNNDLIIKLGLDEA